MILMSIGTDSYVTCHEKVGKALATNHSGFHDALLISFYVLYIFVVCSRIPAKISSYANSLFRLFARTSCLSALVPDL